MKYEHKQKLLRLVINHGERDKTVSTVPGIVCLPYYLVFSINTGLPEVFRCTGSSSSSSMGKMWAWVLVWALVYIFGAGQVQALAQAQIEVPDGLCNTFVRPYSPRYDCQEYSITTEDGFKLGVQRISSSISQQQLNGPVRRSVFLNHGVLSGGDTWVLNPPDQSPAFVLADQGFDVWIGNARTTRYSHGHVSLTQEDADYWDWCVDELASMDLPAMVGMVHSIVGRKIFYIGFSQGTQAALAAMSEGMLVDQLEKVALLAPVAYVTHTYTPIGVAAVVLHLDKVFEAAGLHAFSTKTSEGQQYVDLICKAANLRCYQDLTSAFTGINCCINSSRVAFYDKYETQATSTKNLVHLAQIYRADRFQKYDYGVVGNLVKYRSLVPPRYDLWQVPSEKLMLASGAMDALANPLDVSRLKVELRPGFSQLLKPLYAHLDFILASNCQDEIYKKVVDFFNAS